MDASSMEARIGPNSQVLIHFDLWLADGSAADSTRTQGKPALFQLGNRSLSPALEAQLQGLKTGDTKRLRCNRKRPLACQVLITCTILSVAGSVLKPSRNRV